MNNVIRNSAMALVVVGSLSLAACKTTDSKEAPAAEPAAAPVSEPAPAPAPTDDSSTSTDGTVPTH